MHVGLDRPVAASGITGASAGAPSAWSPLGHPVFRILWIATIVANVGTWVHDVAATWLMTSLAPSPLMVALVQTAGTLPVLMLALPAGVLADVLDRRHVLLFAQVWMTVVALVLGAVTFVGATTPLVLLVLTFLLGIGTALTAPAWQSIVPELVPKAELGAAVTLNSAGINVARAVGPALGGLVVAGLGPATAFALNGVSFAGVIAVLLWWKRAVPAAALPPERLTSAFGTGLRFVRHEPRLIAVLMRTLAFIVFGSALWALLPLIARQRLGTGALGYGLLLGAIGVGALLGTAVLPVARRRLSADRVVTLATLAYAAVVVATGSLDDYAAMLFVLLAGGAAWLMLLATFQAGAQLAVPSWVRGRALAVYLMVFFGGQAAGATVWGTVASQVGISRTLLLASGGLVLGLLAVRRYPLGSSERLDLAPSRHWPAHDPSVMAAGERDSRPVLVVTEYHIAAGDAVAFGTAIDALRLARLRSGAVRWELFQDLDVPGRHVEHFLVPSWNEHLRQHERITGVDHAAQEAVRALNAGNTPPTVTHFVMDAPPMPPISA